MPLSKYKAIPEEMRSLDQWVVWRYIERDGRATKMPYCSKGKPASVTDPATWSSFEQAALASPSYDGIGFVLSHSDPFSIIDLDNKPTSPCTDEQLRRHTLIYETFQSYTEYSVSGTGLHIVVKGRIPAGVHRDNVEVYSDSRFMVCTGLPIRNYPVQNYQDLLVRLYGEMKPPETCSLLDIPANMSDDELISMAMRASNAEKFISLCRGEMTEYPSQSEADFALLSIIAFYTQNNDQVRRIFRLTELGKRDKAQRDDYLNRALEKIRAQQPPPINGADLIANAARIATSKEPTAPEPQETLQLDNISLPPGLIGEMALYFYHTAIRPVPEIALAAAISLAAGVCGRSFNISGTGLNHYIILLARTGTGKEGAAMGIENLVSAARPQLPMVDQFLGPAAFASGQALIKALDDKPSFLSVLGEFGLTLQQLSDHRANSAQVMLKKVLLDIYAKSGWNRFLRSSVYSDVEKNTKIIQAPNVSILGESTPETFFDGLDASHISEGLIPRFSIIEYKGPRPVRNRNANMPPPRELIQRFSDLCAVSITTSNSNACIQIALDDHSLKMMDDFDTRVDGIMNGSKATVEMEIWNRAHLKALKLAGLLAVGTNAHRPVVTRDLAQWAIDFVVSECGRIAERFRAGDVGQGDSKQYNDLRKAIETYLHTSPEKLKSYNISSLMVKDRIIPYSFLIKRTACLASFKNDKLGSTSALKRTIQALLDSGMLVEIPKLRLAQGYKFSGAAYGIGQHW